MAENFLDYSGLTYYDQKVKAVVNTVNNKADVNTSNISSLNTSVSGISSLVSSLNTQVQNLQQTVTSGIPSTSYEVDSTPVSGNTTHVVSSNGVFHAVKSRVGYYICDTAAATAQKSFNASGYLLTSGGNVHVKMAHKNTAAAVTMNINSTGAYTLYFNGLPVSAENTWNDGDILAIFFDGTNYQATYALNVVTGYIITGSTYVFGVADADGRHMLKIDNSGTTSVNALRIFGDAEDALLVSDSDYQFAVKDGTGKVTLGVDHDGNLTFMNDHIEAVNYFEISSNEDWIFGVTDKDKNLLFGVDYKGVFFSSRAQFDEINGETQ